MTPPNIHVLTLRDSKRIHATESHLHDFNLSWSLFYGIDAVKMGLTTVNPYEVDQPGSGYIMPQKHVGMHLSHYLMWRHFWYDHDEAVFTVLEDDCRFVDGWVQRFVKIEDELPIHWDILLLGSCCTDNRPSEKVRDEVFKVEYPLCTHAYMVRRKALPILLETQDRSWAPVDLSLYFSTYPKLKVFTVLPRLAYQEGMDLPI